MPFAVFLRSVKLDKGESNGVHLGFLEYEEGQVVELSETSYARWQARNAIALASAPETPVAAVIETPVAPVAPAKTGSQGKGGKGVPASEAAQETSAVALPPFGTTTEK